MRQGSIKTSFKLTGFTLSFGALPAATMERVLAAIPVAETTVVSQVCPAQNAACGVTCSGGVARCDIVDLKEGTYPGSTATFKKADGTGEQCCYGTVYVDANGEKDNGRS